MEVILLERIQKLGQMGDVVSVRNGYARNFLLPQGKALRSSEANRAIFEARRAELEARNLELRSEAEAVAGKLAEREFVVIRSASDTGSLYGSVTTSNIAAISCEQGVSISRRQIELDRPIKWLGIHKVSVVLHPELTATIDVNVARTPEEAELQAKGEDVIGIDDAAEAEETADIAEETGDAEVDPAAAEQTEAAQTDTAEESDAPEEEAAGS
ncbi:MAG: 50S ribosomal protein L9 [Rhodobacteraceae bacterium]|nr:50S ribosomal protein L9 [Paracoccaceae bacterium]